MTRPLILVDWSPIDDRGQRFLLRVAVLFAGRSLPIFEKVHHQDAPSVRMTVVPSDTLFL